MTTETELRFLLAGTGHIADRHVEAIRRTPGCRLVGVLSRDRNRAQDLADRLQVEAFDDTSAAVGAPGVDAIAVCTRHDRHVELIEAAARHRRHVLVEKPIAIDLAAGLAAVRACAEAGVQVGCVFQRRLEPDLVAVRERFSVGELGAPLGAEASLVWRRDASYYETSPWRAQRAQAGGGVLMMQAIHYVDALRYVLGEVAEVTGRTQRVRVGGDVEDTVSAELQLVGEASTAPTVAATLFATTAARRRLPPRLAFHFEKGSIVLEKERVRTSTLRDRRGWLERAAERIRRRREHRRPDPCVSFQRLYDDFLDAVAVGRSPISGGMDALRTVAVVQAIYRSAERGGAVVTPDWNVDWKT